MGTSQTPLRGRLACPPLVALAGLFGHQPSNIDGPLRLSFLFEVYSLEGFGLCRSRRGC